MKRVLFLSGFLLFSFFVFGQDADSLAVVREVDSLLEKSRQLINAGVYDKALLLGDSANTIIAKTFGENNRLYGRSQFNLGRLYFNQNKHALADRHYQAAVDILERSIGKENAEYAQAVFNLGLSYKNQRKNEAAEKLLLDSKAIRERVLGRESEAYSWCTFQLAELHAYQEHYEQAEQYYRETLAIREKVLGKAHADYLSALNEFGRMLKDASRLQEAESVLQEALAGYKQNGRGNMYYAATLTHLAVVMRNSGRYHEAERYFLDAKELLERLFKEDQLETTYASTVNSLAHLYIMTGRYELAEPLYRRATEIWKKRLGNTHPYYAAGLANLAAHYERMYLHNQAEDMYREALSILDVQHPYHARFLTAYGAFLLKTDKFEEAKQYLEEAYPILSKRLPEDHMDIAGIKTNMGKLYACPCMAQYSRADSLLIQAKNIFDKNGIRQCYDCYLSILQTLGHVQRRQGAYEATLQYYLKTLDIYDTTGIRDLGYLNLLRNTGALYKLTGQPARYFEFLRRSAPFENELLLRATAFMNQPELKQFQEKVALTRHDLGCELVEHPEIDSKLTGILFDHVLSEKGFLMQEAQRLQRMAAHADDSTRQVFLQWKICHRNLSQAYGKATDQRGDIRPLEEEANALEKILVQRISGFAQTRKPVNWRELASTLAPGSVAVEFVHINYSPDSTMYAALLLSPGDIPPHFIPLFEEKQLHRLFPSNARESEQAAHLYASRGVQPVKPGGKPVTIGLYDLLWKPLKKHLKGIKTVYYSPSGLLHRINFDAIPTPKKGTLADQFHLARLGSTRQLVIPTSPAPATNDIALFGGIRYEEADTTSLPPVTAEVFASRTRGELSFTYSDSTLRAGTTWEYLPGTEQEVQVVSDIARSAGVSVRTFSGSGATEEALKSLGIGGGAQATGSPRILHLATHGFFFPDPAVNRQPSTVDREPVFKLSDHPMIRSGLLLAGANHAWATGKPFKPGMEDGILTAYEISQMNLSNTELVVLSACETGLGDIQGNEGVYGLQRAFKIAGAKYLIMSLWQVPDKQTSLLMITFYKNWLEEKITIPEAFRAAQKELREAGLDPYQWAGFVLVE